MIDDTLTTYPSCAEGEGCLGRSITIVRHPGAVLTQREEELHSPDGSAGPLLTDSVTWRELVIALVIFIVGASVIGLGAMVWAFVREVLR